MIKINKEELIKEIKEYKNNNGRNIMGCSENWYDYIFAIKQTFTLNEIEKMTQKEIDNLIKLASNIQEGLF